MTGWLRRLTSWLWGDVCPDCGSALREAPEMPEPFGMGRPHRCEDDWHFLGDIFMADHLAEIHYRWPPRCICPGCQVHYAPESFNPVFNAEIDDLNFGIYRFHCPQCGTITHWDVTPEIPVLLSDKEAADVLRQCHT